MSNFQTTYFVHIGGITFRVVMGVSRSPKHMEIEAEIVIYSMLVPC